MSDPLQQEPTPEPNQRPEPVAPLAPLAPANTWSDNLDLLKSLFLALVFTAVFYEVFPMPFMDEGRLKSMLSNDNWVTPVILGMTVWSLILIAFKAIHFRGERRVWQALQHPSVAPLLSHTIYARDVDRVAVSLRDALQTLRVKRFASSLVYRRVMRVLAFVRNATKKDGLDALLDYQADIDLQKMESSYTVLQVFIWAIPILGFIGTVLGIGYSVNEFAQFIQTANGGGQFTGQMRAALGGVTSGLAVAFNTTYIGLVFVMPVMLLTSLLHKSEEEFLLNIEEFCLQELLPHIHVKPGEEVIAEGYEDHLHRVMRLSETWLGQFEPLVQRLSRQAEMMSHQLAGIQPLVKEFTDRLLLRGRGTSSEPLAPGSGAPEPPERDEDLPRTT